jgi:hypothetical protein
MPLVGVEAKVAVQALAALLLLDTRWEAGVVKEVMKKEIVV